MSTHVVTTSEMLKHRVDDVKTFGLFFAIDGIVAAGHVSVCSYQNRTYLVTDYIHLPKELNTNAHIGAHRSSSFGHITKNDVRYLVAEYIIINKDPAYIQLTDIEPCMVFKLPYVEMDDTGFDEDTLLEVSLYTETLNRLNQIIARLAKLYRYIIPLNTAILEKYMLYSITPKIRGHKRIEFIRISLHHYRHLSLPFIREQAGTVVKLEVNDNTVGLWLACNKRTISCAEDLSLYYGPANTVSSIGDQILDTIRIVEQAMRKQEDEPKLTSSPSTKMYTIDFFTYKPPTTTNTTITTTANTTATTTFTIHPDHIPTVWVDENE